MLREHAKRIVITGATRGLGEALTGEFIRQGHIVAGCGRSASLVHTLSRRHRSPHDFRVVDVSSGHQVRSWVKHVIAHFGYPDLLINNAGVANQPAPFWDVPEAEFNQVVDVNIKGVANVLRTFLPAMLQRGKGVIVNISSGWGRSTSPNVAPYCATKWAIEGLTAALAQELPRDMAAVALSPGVVDTDMLRICFGPSASQYPKPHDWAGDAVELLLRLGPRHNGKSLTTP